MSATNTRISTIAFIARFTSPEMDAIYGNADAKAAFERLTNQDTVDLRGEREHHEFMTLNLFAVGERIHTILELV